MNKLKELMKDNSFIRGSFFIIFNAILLCAMFFIIKNFGNITATLYHWLCVLAFDFRTDFILSSQSSFRID